MDLGPHRVAEGSIDGLMSLNRALAAEGIADDDDIEVAAAGAGAGVPGVPRAVILDGQVQRREGLPQGLLDPFDASHHPGGCKERIAEMQAHLAPGDKS